VVPTVRQVTGTASELVLFLAQWYQLKARNRYCIRDSAISGTVVPTVRQVTGTASEIVLLQV